jgi:cell division protein FtsW
MTEMVHRTLPAQVGEPILSRWWRTVDHWTIAAVLGLFGVGLLLAMAASPPLAARNNLSPFHYFERQLMFGVLAMAVMLGLSMLTPQRIRRLAVLGFVVSFAALLVLPFVGVDHGKGAIRWFSIAGISLQPSEFLKPCLAIFAAWMLAAGQELNGPPGRSLSLGVTTAVVLLLALQPDFGQATLVLIGWGVMYFVSGAPMILILAIVVLAGFGGLIAYNGSQHFARRIDAFLSNEVDARSQIGYATSAIQEGGLFGMGVGEGQVKWQLPDAHTDFIIAVAAEEYGFVLVAAIIVLYATICLRALSRLTRERDPFIRLAGVGLVAMVSAQAMINMGVAARLLPAKGMTLPFISYGGSSLLAMGITLGMLLALTRSRPQGEFSDFMRGHR